MIESNHSTTNLTSAPTWFLDNNSPSFCVQNVAVIKGNTAQITDTHWHHLAVTRGLKNEWFFYKDGVIECNVHNIAIPNYNDDGTLKIGGRKSQCFNGILTHVAIYNKALSLGQLQEHYRIGKELMTNTIQ